MWLVVLELLGRAFQELGKPCIQLRLNACCCVQEVVNTGLKGIAVVARRYKRLKVAARITLSCICREWPHRATLGHFGP